MPLTAVTPDDLPALASIISIAFGSDAEGAKKWLGGAGIENLRVVREPGQKAEGASASGGIAATLLRVPMGHFFGGRSVACIGIAGVAVPPEQRGSGVASALMREALREIHDQGVALSSLYASTQTLYRRVGYEQAWHRVEWMMPLARVRVDPPGPRVHRAQTDDLSVQERIRGVYAAFARTQSAMLDRGAYVWNRVFNPRDGVGSVLLIGDDASAPEGYLVFGQERDAKTGRHDVVLYDVAATTPAGWARALGVLGRFRTMGNEARFFAGPWHPWFMLEVDQIARPVKSEIGLLRIVRVAEALEGRGYAASVRATIDLELSDGVLPENAGRWRVEVEGGRARVSRGGTGQVRLGVGGLASLYSGFVTGAQARAVGWAEGPAETVETLGAVFAGPTPWMPNMF